MPLYGIQLILMIQLISPIVLFLIAAKVTINSDIIIWHIRWSTVNVKNENGVERKKEKKRFWKVIRYQLHCLLNLNVGRNRSDLEIRQSQELAVRSDVRVCTTDLSKSQKTLKTKSVDGGNQLGVIWYLMQNCVVRFSTIVSITDKVWLKNECNKTSDSLAWYWLKVSKCYTRCSTLPRC